MFHVFLTILVVLMAGIGFVILKKNIARVDNVIFAFLTWFAALWVLTTLFADISRDIEVATFWVRATIIGPIFFFLLLYDFSLTFPKQIKNPFLNYLYYFFLLASICLFVFSFTSGNISSSYFDANGFIVVKPGILYPFFFLYVLLITVFSFKNFMYSLNNVTGIYRSQIRYLLAGLSLMYGSAVFTNVLLLMFGITNLARFGSSFSIFFVAFTAHAIIAHRLFDIRVIIRRTVVFAGLSAFVLGSYAVIMFTATSLIGGLGQSAFSAAQFVPNMIAAFAIAFGFEPLRRWLSQTTDVWLFAAEYDRATLLQDLSMNLANAVDLVDAVEAMVEIITKQMRLTNGAVFLIQPAEEKGEYELKQLISAGYTETEKQQLSLLSKDVLVRFFHHSHRGEREHVSLVVLDELERRYMGHHASSAHATLTLSFVERVRTIRGAVAMPLYITRREPIPTPPGTPPKYKEVETFIGVVVLGEKKSGDAFTDEDLRLLEIVASQTAGAVEKSRLFEEDQLKSEFVAVASHELLTPTAAMEGYLSMILDEGLGKVDKQARTYLETVYAESKRLATLVKDLLNVSRIERGKIMVNVSPLSLSDVIMQTLAALKFRAEERNITLSFEKPATNLPNVMADADKLTEVLMNLIGNAIKYTREGGTATITVHHEKQFVIVDVADNGIGMKPEDVTHLFSKFFRASNSDQTGQGGTGLGLYITKNVIELMGGTITVKSEVDKGSTFTFSLPVAK